MVWRAALVCGLSGGGGTVASAQFLRLGPFDVDANTTLNLIYTTNVDGTRESESELEREDYYLLWSFDMTMTGPTTPSSDMDLSTAMSIEKHFVRDDLDTSSDPFGNILFNHELELGRLVLPTTLEFNRRNIQDDDGTTRIFIPGQRQERIVQDTRSFDQQAIWEYRTFRADAGYRYRQIRFVDEPYQEGDEDQEGMSFGAAWDILRWEDRGVLSLFYTYDRQRTDLINRPDADGSGEWETDQSYGLGLDITVLTRPKLTYSLARTKSDDEDWRVVHTFTLADQWDLSEVMVLDANATYRIDEQPREDDVAFTYAVGLAHEIGETLRHSVRADRQPVDTFGTTADTDRTTVTYNLIKNDLFFANITGNAGVTWQRNEPQGPDAGPVEETTTYTAGLSHSTQVSRRLSRDLSYVYRWTESNSEDEPIEEHRVQLGFTFTF